MITHNDEKLFDSIFNANILPKIITSREFFLEYKLWAHYVNSEDKPLFILRYSKPDVVLLGIEAWQKVSEAITSAKRVERIASICPQCSIILYGPQAS